jgi:hypothetical protein
MKMGRRLRGTKGIREIRDNKNLQNRYMRVIDNPKNGGTSSELY